MPNRSQGEEKNGIYVSSTKEEYVQTRCRHYRNAIEQSATIQMQKMRGDLFSAITRLGRELEVTCEHLLNAVPPENAQVDIWFYGDQLMRVAVRDSNGTWIEQDQENSYRENVRMPKNAQAYIKKENGEWRLLWGPCPHDGFCQMGPSKCPHNVANYAMGGGIVCSFEHVHRGGPIIW